MTAETEAGLKIFMSLRLDRRTIVMEPFNVPLSLHSLLRDNHEMKYSCSDVL